VAWLCRVGVISPAAATVPLSMITPFTVIRYVLAWEYITWGLNTTANTTVIIIGYEYSLGFY
jgi:hypothetical protein